MSETIALSPEIVHTLATQIVAAYEELGGRSSASTDSGAKNALVASFRRTLGGVLTRHTNNREALVVRLSQYTESMRTGLLEFEQLDAEMRSVLEGMAQHAQDIPAHTPAPQPGSQSTAAAPPPSATTPAPETTPSAGTATAARSGAGDRVGGW